MPSLSTPVSVSVIIGRPSSSTDRTPNDVSSMHGCCSAVKTPHCYRDWSILVPTAHSLAYPPPAAASTPEATGFFVHFKIDDRTRRLVNVSASERASEERRCQQRRVRLISTKVGRRGITPSWWRMARDLAAARRRSYRTCLLARSFVLLASRGTGPRILHLPSTNGCLHRRLLYAEYFCVARRPYAGAEPGARYRAARWSSTAAIVSRMVADTRRCR